MAIITAAEFKTYLGITSSNDDALIASLLLSAQKFFELETDKIFDVSAATTRYFTYGEHTSRDGMTLYLDTYLVSVTTLTNGDGTVIASNKYKLYPLNRSPYSQIRLLSCSGYSWTYDDDPEGAISVNGLWGWSSTPDDSIKQLMKRLTGFYYRQKDAQAYDLAGFSEIGVIRVKHKLPEDIEKMIDYYRTLT